MNTQIITGILLTVRSVLTWLTAKQQGDSAKAIEIIKAVDLTPYGLDKDVLNIVNYTRAGLSYLTARGIVLDEAMDLVQRAEEEQRDITVAEIREQLNLAKVEFDETQALIDAME